MGKRKGVQGHHGQWLRLPLKWKSPISFCASSPQNSHHDNSLQYLVGISAPKKIFSPPPPPIPRKHPPRLAPRPPRPHPPRPPPPLLGFSIKKIPPLPAPRTPPSPPPSRKNKKYPKRPPRIMLADAWDKPVFRDWGLNTCAGTSGRTSVIGHAR